MLVQNAPQDLSVHKILLSDVKDGPLRQAISRPRMRLCRFSCGIPPPRRTASLGKLWIAARGNGKTQFCNVIPVHRKSPALKHFCHSGLDPESILVVGQIPPGFDDLLSGLTSGRLTRRNWPCRVGREPRAPDKIRP
jgi:hypothetical protein